MDRLTDRDWSADVVVGVQQERWQVDLRKDMALVIEAGARHGAKSVRAERLHTVDEAGNQLTPGCWREHRRRHGGGEFVGRKPRCLERSSEPLLGLVNSQ